MQNLRLKIQQTKKEYWMFRRKKEHFVNVIVEEKPSREKLKMLIFTNSKLLFYSYLEHFYCKLFLPNRKKFKLKVIRRQIKVKQCQQLQRSLKFRYFLGWRFWEKKFDKKSFLGLCHRRRRWYGKVLDVKRQVNRVKCSFAQTEKKIETKSHLM